MRAKNLALRVLSTAAMLSIVTSIAAPAFAATYYINDGSVDVTVSDAGVVTVEQSGVTYTDGLDSVVIRGGTRSEGEADDRTKADASPATQEADGSNAPTVNETEAPKSENTAGDTAPKQETTAAEERKEGTPQQELTEEKEEEEEQQEPTEEKVTPEPVKAKAAQEPSAEQEEQKEQKEQEEDKEDEPTVPSAPAAQADNSSTSTPAAPTENVITIVNNFVNDAKQAFSFVLDNVNIDRSKDYYDNSSAALTVKGNGDTEIELDGDNILKGGSYHAGLEKNDSDGTGTLTIKDDEKAVDGSKASLLAKGGYDGAGIGGGSRQDTSNITITGGKITAVSGAYAAGIGGGYQSDGTDITIKGDATVIASGDTGAGIGGGGDGKGYGKVTITDHANVTAWSEFGAGIGGGRYASGDIIISGDATVAAEAYNDSIAIGSGGRSYSLLDTNITIRDRANVTAVGSGWHPAIGSRGYVFSGSVSHPFTTTINILGGTLNVINRGDNHYTSNVPAIGNESSNYSTATKADLVLNINASTGDTVINAYTTGSNAATIGIGNHDALMKDDEQIQYNADGSSKFGKAGSVVLNLFRNSTTEKTGEKIETDNDCWYDLHKIISGERYDTLHNAQWLKDNGYTSELATDTTHAWTVDNTKERVEPTPEHEGHVYYKCSVPGCKAVHDEVLPQLQPEPTPEPTPDPTPVQPEPTPVPTPDPTPAQPDPAPVQPDMPADTQSTPKLYVIDLASTQVLFDETRQDDTVTYTTKQDGASLTGSFEALEAMAADGVKTIVFQTIGTNTPGAVSRVSVDALLQHGGETLLLTHNGTEVHLTIDGQNADSLLLQ
jgi:outer membrane biosynthesis protein TonB